MAIIKNTAWLIWTALSDSKDIALILRPQTHAFYLIRMIKDHLTLTKVLL